MTSSIWTRVQAILSSDDVEYARVMDKDLNGEENTPPLARQRVCSKTTFDLLLRLLPWLITALSLATVIWSLRTKRFCPTSSSESIFATEFQPAASVLSYKQVRFKTGIRHAPNGTLIRTNTQFQQPSYVGTPHPDLDVAWFELTKGLDLYVTAAEASRLPGNLHQFSETAMYSTEIEWLHNLHCLNYLRKSYDPKYYELDLHHPEQSHRTHIDHCIDALRQVLQCHGDLTPLPKMWDAETQREYTDFERVHTCRDVDALRSWATSRSYDNYERGVNVGDKHDRT